MAHTRASFNQRTSCAHGIVCNVEVRKPGACTYLGCSQWKKMDAWHQKDRVKVLWKPPG